MALPKLVTPEYTITVPSTGEEIKFRPFLVKEEKVLLIALESEDETTINDAIMSIVKECTFGKSGYSDTPLFEIEYLFINIRGKSVGDLIKLSVTCPDDNETEVSLEIPLDEIHVTFTEGHTNKVQLTDTIGMTMKYPDFTLASLQRDSGSEYLFDMIKGCIAQITEGETVHERVDFNDAELDTFLDSLNTKQLEGVQKFFETMPKLKHEVKVTNPKTKKKSTVTLEGLEAFFD